LKKLIREEMSVNKILIVEDDIDDRELLDDAMKQANPSVNLIFAENGLDALKYLEQIKENPAQLPCLIVLDLNMPFIDGIETFRRIQEHVTFKEVPIIIFTSSMNPADRDFFESLGVRFMTKPDHFDVFHDAVSQMLHTCKEHWVQRKSIKN